MTFAQAINKANTIDISVHSPSHGLVRVPISKNNARCVFGKIYVDTFTKDDSGGDLYCLTDWGETVWTFERWADGSTSLLIG